METIEAVVGEDGVLHVENVPFQAGTRVRVVEATAGDDFERQERDEFVARFFGSVRDEDFEIARSLPPTLIEPIA